MKTRLGRVRLQRNSSSSPFRLNSKKPKRKSPSSQRANPPLRLRPRSRRMIPQTRQFLLVLAHPKSNPIRPSSLSGATSAKAIRPSLLVMIRPITGVATMVTGAVMKKRIARPRRRRMLNPSLTLRMVMVLLQNQLSTLLRHSLQSPELTLKTWTVMKKIPNEGPARVGLVIS